MVALPNLGHYPLGEVRVAGKVTVHALDSLPLSAMLVLILAIAYFGLFQSPTPHPTPHLIPLQSPRGPYVYLDPSVRRLVISDTPLPAAPPRSPVCRAEKIRRAFRAYRCPLGCVPEAEAEGDERQGEGDDDDEGEYLCEKDGDAYDMV